MAIRSTNGAGGGNWSDPNTWEDGVVPASTDQILVQDGDTLVIDGDIEALGGTRTSSTYATKACIWVKGTLTVDKSANTSLKTKGLIYLKPDSGAHNPIIDFGTEADPVTGSFTWITNPEKHQVTGYLRLIYASYYSSYRSKIYMYGGTVRRRNTFLIGAFDAGSTQITVDNADGWQVGDELYLVPRYTDPLDAYLKAEYETGTISAINGTDITLSSATQYDHGYSDSRDYPAGAVINTTSNIIIDAGGNDRYMPYIDATRTTVNIQNVVFKNANNVYNYASAIVKSYYAGYDNQETVLKGTVLITDLRGWAKTQKGSVYIGNALTSVEVDDVAIIGIGTTSGQRLDTGFSNLFGGRAPVMNRVGIYGGNDGYWYNAFSNNQQPALYRDFVVVGSRRAFAQQHSVDITTERGWVVGSDRIGDAIDATAVFKDTHIRFVNRVSDMPADWRSKAKFIRPDWRDGHVYNAEKSLVTQNANADPIDIAELIEYANDPTNMRWFYKKGQKWWEHTTVRNDPHSIGMKSDSDDYPVPHELEFEAEAGDTVLAGLYVRNLTNSYVGELKLTLMQGSDLIAEQTYDLTALTTGKWSLLTVAGTATQTRTVQYSIEYKGAGGEIAVTDFQYPLSEKLTDIARAVWSHDVTDYNTAGQAGKELQDAADCDGSGGGGSGDVNVVSVGGVTVNSPDDFKADVSNLATQATADAIKAKTDALPNDPAREASVQAIPTNPVLTTDSRLDHLDADVSSRLATSAYIAPPSTADIDNALSGSHGSGSWVTADTSALALEATVQAVKSKTDALPADPASQADVQAVAAQVWAQALEGTLTYEAGLRIMLAVLAGTVDGAGTDIEQFYSQDGSKIRVRSHVDSMGNRTQVEVDGS